MTDEISHATVREFHDFAERWPDVTKLNEDLKSFQRPWVVDRLVRHLPGGGRVLEIGADKCDLVDTLRARGFDVWVVDVYDRFGGGTATYDLVRNKYPDLPITRTFLHEDRSLKPGSFDAVYSCSVIEHTPPQHVAATCRRIGELLKDGGLSIHAIDWTVQGAVLMNAELIEQFVEGHNRRVDMNELARKTLADIDTYYLSPQGHLRWRKFVGKTYDQYPYRRVTSMGFVARKNGDHF
ncbi:MAG: class I SAM-dependent methyltransferase [Tepidisphaeraceae bacterium]